MKILLFTLTAVFSLAAAPSVIAAEGLPPNEPTHEGKPVSYWVAALEPTRSVSRQLQQAAAEEAIHALGPNAMPFILRYSDGPREQRLGLIRHACAILEPEADLKLVEALSDPNPTVRETALEVLSKTALPAALDDVVRLLADPNRSVQTAAILAMVRLAPGHEETVAALVAALHDLRPRSGARADEFSRADAALTLATLGPKAKAAVPELTSLLADADDETREAAAVALWKIEKNTQVVSVLADRLENATDYKTCVRVMKILAEMGPLAKSAAFVISKKIDDPGVRFVPDAVAFTELAVETLAKVDPAEAAEVRRKLQQSPRTGP